MCRCATGEPYTPLGGTPATRRSYGGLPQATTPTAVERRFGAVSTMPSRLNAPSTVPPTANLVGTIWPLDAIPRIPVCQLAPEPSAPVLPAGAAATEVRFGRSPVMSRAVSPARLETLEDVRQIARYRAGPMIAVRASGEPVGLPQVPSLVRRAVVPAVAGAAVLAALAAGYVYWKRDAVPARRSRS